MFLCFFIYNIQVFISLYSFVLRRGVFDTTLGNKVCRRHAASRWFYLGTLVSYTNKTDHHDITEILLKVVLN